jgi:hypothetical protein
MKKIIFKLINIDILIKVLYGKIILILIIIYKILPKQFQFCNTGVKNLEDLKKYSRNNLYKLLNNFFYFDLDLDLFLHRNFFQKEKFSSFGDNNFHSMWYLIFKNFKPVNCLEIGVYKGQVITLFSLLMKKFKYKGKVFALSPFSDVGDSTSDYKKTNYLKITREAYNTLKLPRPIYCISLSHLKKGKMFISKNKFDLIYIDGNHDYEIIRSDYINCLKSLNQYGILVLDDSSLHTNFNLSFKGHAGPSRIFRSALREKRLKFLFGCGHNNVFQKTI